MSLPISYRIGAEDAPPETGRVVVAPYEVRPPAGGVWYFNVLDQRESYDPDANDGKFGPYLDPTDTAADYDEGVVDPRGKGWWPHVDEQLSRARPGDRCEWDNVDAHDDEVVESLYDHTFFAGIGVWVKNPGTRLRLLLHAAAVGVVQENDSSLPAAALLSRLHSLRVAAGKPNLPLRLVAFDDGEGGREWAEAAAAEVRRLRLANVGITYDSSDEEYGGDRIEDLQLPIEVQTMAWRLARSLETLRSEINMRFPNRDKSWDGTIGDEAHQQRQSDHNVNEAGVVTAADFTSDTSGGPTGDMIADAIASLRDDRVKLMIHRNRIMSGNAGPQPWVWRARNKGPSDHAHHIHISVGRGEENHTTNPELYDDPRSWVLGLSGSTSSAPPAPHPATQRRRLKRGDTGPDVFELQQLLGFLGGDVDGVFGDDTDLAVRTLQRDHGIEDDGIVGPYTWEALLGDQPAAPPAPSALSKEVVDRVTALAASSEIARYSWKDRGVAPIGYVKGMAVCFAKALVDLKAGRSHAVAMARPVAGDTSRDALAWYGVVHTGGGVLTLQALFVMLIGLGMRESSGKYWEGLDVKAGFKSADETEAGLFQQSWNSRGASPELPKLFDAWSADSSDGFLSIFREGVPAGSSPNLGGGQGEEFQRLCKTKPAFAVECAAIACRVLGGSDGHFGPIRRHEVEMRPEADALLGKVRAIVEAPAVQPPVKPPAKPPALPVEPPPPPPPPAFEDKVEAFMREVTAAIRPVAERYVGAADAALRDAASRQREFSEQLAQLLDKARGRSDTKVEATKPQRSSPPQTRSAPMFNFNQEQMKSAIRSVLIALGSTLATWAAARGWMQGEEIIRSIFSSEAFVGIVVALASAVFGVTSKTQSNLIVAAANANPAFEAAKITDPKLAREVEAKGADIQVEKT